MLRGRSSESTTPCREREKEGRRDEGRGREGDGGRGGEVQSGRERKRKGEIGREREWVKRRRKEVSGHSYGAP